MPIRADDEAMLRRRPRKQMIKKYPAADVLTMTAMFDLVQRRLRRGAEAALGAAG